MTWKDVDLKKFYQIRDILSTDDDYMVLNLIDCIYGVNAEELPVNELTKYSIDFVRQPIEEVLVNEITINGNKYDIDTKLNEVTASQFIDFNNYMSGNEYKYEDVLSVFVIPDGHKYNDGYDIEAVKADILNMPMTNIFGLAKFFFQQYKLFVEIFQLYLIQLVKETKIPETEKENLLRKLIVTDLAPME